MIFNVIDVMKYLERINVFSEVHPDLLTLFLLHHRHPHSVPFENFGVHSGRKIILEEEKPKFPVFKVK